MTNLLTLSVRRCLDKSASMLISYTDETGHAKDPD